jgi:hypothetical protein
MAARLVILVALARVAAAEPLAVAPPGLTPVVELPAGPPLEPSYRRQTVIADGIAMGLLVIGIRTNNEAVGYMSLGTYAGAAPLVHLAHHRPGHAAASLGLRVGLPILGGILGDKLGRGSRCSGDVCVDESDEFMAFGVLGGIAAAMVLDTSLLAKEDEAPAPAGWSPAIAARRDGITLGFSGSF